MSCRFPRLEPSEQGLEHLRRPFVRRSGAGFGSGATSAVEAEPWLRTKLVGESREARKKFSDSFALFVLLTFDFFAGREESIEKKSRDLRRPARLDCFFVVFVVQILVQIGLPGEEDVRHVLWGI